MCLDVCAPKPYLFMFVTMVDFLPHKGDNKDCNFVDFVFIFGEDC